MKSKKILYLSLILLILMISAVIYIVIFNKYNVINEKNEINKVDNKDEIENLNEEKWYLKDIKVYNNPEEDAFKIPLKSLTFKEKYIDICYQQGCYSAKYKINDNTLYIEEGNHISGELKMSYENYKMYLEYQFPDKTKIIYVFEKEDN